MACIREWTAIIGELTRGIEGRIRVALGSGRRGPPVPPVRLIVCGSTEPVVECRGEFSEPAALIFWFTYSRFIMEFPLRRAFNGDGAPLAELAQVMGASIRDTGTSLHTGSG